jgi:hypothetical protein
MAKHRRCRAYKLLAGQAEQLAQHISMKATGATIHKANQHIHVLRAADLLCQRCGGKDSATCPLKKVLVEIEVWSIVNSRIWQGR